MKNRLLLQPLVHQFGGASVEFVGASFDVGEHVGDAGEVLEFAAAAVPCRGCVGRLVGICRRGCDRVALGWGLLWFRVGVDGQVAVRAEVPGQQVPGPAGQRVRGEPLEWEGQGCRLSH